MTHTAKHTPGPWKWSQESVDPAWAIVTSEGGNIVANVNSETGPDILPLVSTKMPQHANAALIAAAPAMYEALYKLMLEAIHYRNTGGGEQFLTLAIEQAQNALTQAEGSAK